MHIPKIRITYIFSLVLLAVLVALAVFQPFGKSGEYTEVQQEQILETDSEWIIQLNIINNEKEQQNYKIDVLSDKEEHSENISIKDGGIFAFIYHIQRESVSTGEIKIIIYREGTDDPLEQLTYYLR